MYWRTHKKACQGWAVPSSGQFVTLIPQLLYTCISFFRIMELQVLLAGFLQFWKSPMQISTEKAIWRGFKVGNFCHLFNLARFTRGVVLNLTGDLWYTFEGKIIKNYHFWLLGDHCWKSSFWVPDQSLGVIKGAHCMPKIVFLFLFSKYSFFVALLISS